MTRDPIAVLAEDNARLVGALEAIRSAGQCDDKFLGDPWMLCYERGDCPPDEWCGWCIATVALAAHELEVHATEAPTPDPASTNAGSGPGGRSPVDVGGGAITGYRFASEADRA